MRTPLRVAGAHLVTAAGEGVDPAWEALLAGRTLLAPDPELPGFAPIVTARCRPIDPAALGVDVRAARLMDHHTHMMLLSAAGALRAAGLGPEEISEGALAFYVGMDSVDPRDGDIMPAVAASVGADGGLDLGRYFAGGLNRIPPLWALSMVNAIAFCQIAIQYQIHGDNAVFTPGADAAVRAVIEAGETLRAGRARFAMAAGVGPVISSRAIGRYRKQGNLPPAAGGEAPRPRPFAKGGGAALGEGAAALVLAPAGEAGPALGMICGGGAAGARGGAEGLAAAIVRSAEDALGRAALAPDEIGLVIPHGAGVEAADQIEEEALARIFGGRRPQGLATKGAFGHMLGAGPVADLLLALRALSEKTVPPSPGAGPGAALSFPEAPEALQGPPAALILSRGMAGECGALVASAA